MEENAATKLGHVKSIEYFAMLDELAKGERKKIDPGMNEDHQT